MNAILYLCEDPRLIKKRLRSVRKSFIILLLHTYTLKKITIYNIIKYNIHIHRDAKNPDITIDFFVAVT